MTVVDDCLRENEDNAVIMFARGQIFCLSVMAAALLPVYICWNLFFLAHGRTAPSLLLALTGRPSPTTGMTRSLNTCCTEMRLRHCNGTH